MMGNWSIRIVLTLAVTFAAAAGCGANNTRDHDAQVRAASEAEVAGQIVTLARDVATVLGAKPIRPASNTSECENDVGDDSGEVRFVQGTYQLPVADAHDRANFTKVRDHWRNQGWTVVDDWYKQETRAGSVSTEAADGSLSFTLSGTGSPKLLALIIHSGCFRDRS